MISWTGDTEIIITDRPSRCFEIIGRDKSGDEGIRHDEFMCLTLFIMFTEKLDNRSIHLFKDIVNIFEPVFLLIIFQNFPIGVNFMC